MSTGLSKKIVRFHAIEVQFPLDSEMFYLCPQSSISTAVNNLQLKSQAHPKSYQLLNSKPLIAATDTSLRCMLYWTTLKVSDPSLMREIWNV